MSRVFLSHSHADHAFVRQLAADLSALGVGVWLYEAEINIGDSLVAKISTAIDQVEYLAVILSPHSVESRWVQQELEQALDSQIAGRTLKVLPILLRDCSIPGFLRGKRWADFRDRDNYEQSLVLLLRSLGIDNGRAEGGRLFDPFAGRYGRLRTLYARPKTWHCIFCGWRCDETYNDYGCKACNKLRPFAGGSATMIRCSACSQWSLGVAEYCEWCGGRFVQSEPRPANPGPAVDG
jgi:hypothetical protein